MGNESSFVRRNLVIDIADQMDKTEREEKNQDYISIF